MACACAPDGLPAGPSDLDGTLSAPGPSPPAGGMGSHASWQGAAGRDAGLPAFTGSGFAAGRFAASLLEGRSFLAGWTLGFAISGPSLLETGFSLADEGDASGALAASRGFASETAAGLGFGGSGRAGAASMLFGSPLGSAGFCWTSCREAPVFCARGSCALPVLAARAACPAPSRTTIALITPPVGEESRGFAGGGARSAADKAATAAARPAALEIRSSLGTIGFRRCRAAALHGDEDPAACVLARKIGHLHQDPGGGALVDDDLEHRFPAF